ncbi:phosphoheptose isomerase [Tistlia consotensis]|uniref:Phosphoheptose isomerase n=1 Tax=Tistlia consotensis USBA 355 TaxID=560819 RepID=A0A1Y6CG89_9PROT|nr:D-sedoheptulose 7-phosphate isomerase [Tistlia consotensis]SMF63251.1 phosphoheptose isomerase [Tistlia consotensis USBA 355]SNR95937.1 phosphoheptose isomerase [Tistlia consotensis]
MFTSTSCFDFDRYLATELEEHASVFSATRGVAGAAMGRLLDACEASVRDGGKLLFFGNGGSAGDAQHLATELVVRYRKDRPALPAIALTVDSSALTAVGNDLGFERLFARQIEALGRKGDVAIGISTSGRSPNVLAALKVARERGLVAAGFTGHGGAMAELADPLIRVPSDNPARIQEMHIMLGQILCGALERRLGLVEDEE